MIIDTDTNCTGQLPVLQRNGVTIVGRYYCADQSSYKLIQRDEAKYLSKNNIKIFVVYEDHAVLSLTKQQGRDDADRAMNCAAAIKQPRGSAIYFAAEGPDGGYGSAHLEGLRKYFSGVTEKIGTAFDIGVYGGGIVCRTMRDERYCKFTWLASASTGWEGTCDFYGHKTPEWDLCQVPPLDMSEAEGWPGLSVDIDLNNPRRHNGDFGAFLVPTSDA